MSYVPLFSSTGAWSIGNGVEGAAAIYRSRPRQAGHQVSGKGVGPREIQPPAPGPANQMFLSRQYPITDCYVKSESAAVQEGRVHKGGAFEVQLRHEGTNIIGKRVINDYKMQLNDALIA
jgi:hypothetical protein